MNTAIRTRSRKVATLTASALAASLVFSASGSAQSVPDPDETSQGDVALTIYNSNLVMVQDVRQIAIARGQSRVDLPDVSAQIRPQTLSFYAPDTTIIEQNFDYDLLTPTKLMEKAIGQTVTLIRTNPAKPVIVFLFFGRSDGPCFGERKDPHSFS